MIVAARLAASEVLKTLATAETVTAIFAGLGAEGASTPIPVTPLATVLVLMEKPRRLVAATGPLRAETGPPLRQCLPTNGTSASAS